MPSASQIPFNIDLLTLTDKDIQLMLPVDTLDIFDKNSKNFSDSGLFSTKIFGRVGEERRNRSFGYIDLKVSVFHPLIYKTFLQLKALYGDIMSGSTYAVFDESVGDFVKSTPGDGQTGFSFFTKHFKKIKFDSRNSDKRDFNIRLVEKYKDRVLMDKLLVMPAGIRDYEIDKTGKPSKDEINDFYTRIMAMANIIDPVMMRISEEMLDSTRFSLQKAVFELYDYIQVMLDGKKKLVLGKWASRRIFNGTRNVISSMLNNTDELGGELTIGYNQTTCGLYQFLKASQPIAIHHIRSQHLLKVFPGANLPAVLVNPKTLKQEMVHLDPEHYDEWMTEEGLEKVINRFGEEELRHLPIKIGKYYLGLIYKGPNKTFRFLQDTGELPDGFDKADVSPITFAELFYISVYQDANTFPCFVTRYPITGYGGIYPGYVFLKTTVRSEIYTELDDNWEPVDYRATQFPIRGESFVNSMSPHSSHLARLDADFDGDTMSLNIVYTEEAKEEVKKVLNSRAYYVGTNGKMNFSASNDTINYTLASITA